MGRALLRRLRAHGVRGRLYFERPSDLPPEVLGPATQARAVVVIGGDGTLREVARRLYEQRQGPAPPLLVLPCGTANLMCRHLGVAVPRIQWSRHVLRILRTGSIRRLDAPTLNGRLFLLMAGIGIDAQIVHEMQRTRSGPIRLWSYARPVLRALLHYQYPPIEVHVDGRCIQPMAPAMAFVGNIREYGTGFPMTPLARSDDRMLDVCIMPCTGARDALPLLLAAAAGEHMRGEGVLYARGRCVEVRSQSGVPVQVDGEAAGFTPVTISLLSRQVDFLVPQMVPGP